MSSQDSILLEAIEAGDIVRVRGALRAGALPHARKSSTMTWVVFPRKEDREGKTVGVGDAENKEETHEGESALALAIVSGRADIAQTILQSGADPNQPIEWKISASREEGDVWTKDSWESYHHLAFSFPNALVFALGGRGGRVRWNCGSGRPDWQGEMERGDFRLNKNGAVLRVDNAGSDADSCAVHKLTPSLDIVSLLLRHGVRVTEAATQAAGRLDDPRFSHLLAHHQELLIKEVLAQHDAALAAMPPRASIIGIHAPAGVSREGGPVSELAPSSSASPATAPAASNPELEKWIATLEARVLALESANASLTSDAAAARDNAAALRAQVAALETEVASGKFEVVALKAVVADLTREVAALGRRVGGAAAGGGASGGSGPAEKIMVVAVAYEPKAKDELALVVGKRVFVKATHADGWGEGLDLTTSTQGFFPLSNLYDPNLPAVGSTATQSVAAPRSASLARHG